MIEGKQSTKDKVVKRQGQLPNPDQYADILEYIEQLDLTKNSALTEEQQRITREFLRKNVAMFATNPKGPAISPAVKHYIDTGDHAPIKCKPHRSSPAELEIIHKEVLEMLKNKVIRHSSSPWAAPVTLAPKPDGSIRFCVDFRKLNAVTRKDVYPLPRIDETLETMRGLEFYTSIDLASGYWQVEIQEQHKEKSAFITRNGLFEFNVMPFGLTNAPATFQRLMDNVVRDIPWTAGQDYMDDVLVGSHSFQDHLRDVQLLFDRLQQHGLSIKISKCNFFKEKLIYLGHELSKHGIRPNSAKIEAITRITAPKDISALKRFLGMTSYYRRFIKNYATIAQPLTNLMGKDSLYK